MKCSRPTILALSLFSLAGLSAVDALASTDLTQSALLERLLNENARARFADLETDIAETQVDFEEGFYQASFYSRLRESDEQTPNSAEDTITRFNRDTAVFEEDRSDYEMGVRVPVRTGAELTLSWRGIRRDNTFTGQVGQGSSEYVGGLDLSVRQPLWRNALGREQALAIRQAELERERTELDGLQQHLDIAFQGLRQYWLLYRRQQFQAIDRDAVDTARQTLQVTRDLVAAGLQPEVAQLEVEARLLERQAELRSSESAVAEARAELDTLLNRDPETAAAERLRIADQPESRKVVPPIDFRVYADEVLAQWPEYARARLAREIESRRRDAALESGKPDLAILLGYSTAALGGDQASIWGEDLADGVASWYVGLELDVTLGANRQAEALASAATLRMSQAQIDAESVRMNVFNGLLTRLEQAEAGHQQMQWMQQRESLQERIFERQEAQFEAGQIPVGVLHDAMDDLIEARRKAVDAQVAYQLAVIALRLVEGSLFVEYGLSEAQTPRLRLDGGSSL